MLLKENEAKSFIDSALSSFKCHKSEDEEIFLHEKAVPYENMNKARTFLVYNKDYTLLLGYFTLAFKSIELQNVSKDLKKRLTAGESAETYAAFLIGHLAKNDGHKDLIDGSVLLEEAINIILQAQELVGGRLMYIDCKDIKRLKEFYEKNGFVCFKTSEQTGLLQYYKKI